MATKTDTHATKLEHSVKELIAALDGIPTPGHLEETIPFFYLHGFTTPAEWRMLLGTLETMTAMAQGLTRLVGEFDAGVREIAQQAERG